MNDYLARVGLTQPVELPELMWAHVQHIPFENLSVLAGQPILLDPDSLWKKLVTERRGGYCFEHNTLFEKLLLNLGYDLVPLQARVRRGVQEIRPQTHKLLRVTYHGQDYLVDVGFGGEGPSQPLLWLEGKEQEFQPGIRHRLIRENDLWVLQCRHDDDPWVDLYATDNQRAYPVDYEMANWFTSTYPDSIFVKSMLVSHHHPGGYTSLFDGLLRQRKDGITSTTRLHQQGEILATLKSQFHLNPPSGMRVPH